MDSCHGAPKSDHRRFVRREGAVGIQNAREIASGFENGAQLVPWLQSLPRYSEEIRKKPDGKGFFLKRRVVHLWSDNNEIIGKLEFYYLLVFNKLIASRVVPNAHKCHLAELIVDGEGRVRRDAIRVRHAPCACGPDRVTCSEDRLCTTFLAANLEQFDPDYFWTEVQVN